MDCSPPGSFAHEISQAGILEWVASFFSNLGIVAPALAGRFFTTEPPGKPIYAASKYKQVKTLAVFALQSLKLP